MEDAARMAYKDMVRWVQEKTGMSDMEAYLFVSHNVQASIAQMVDPQYTVMVKLLKNRLPLAKPPSTEAR